MCLKKLKKNISLTDQGVGIKDRLKADAGWYMFNVSGMNE